MISEVQPRLLAFRGLSDEDDEETDIPETPDENLNGDLEDEEHDGGFGSDPGGEGDGKSDGEF